MRKSTIFLSVLGSIALFFANTGVSTTCFGLFAQPKFPQRLQK